jgi:GT2 family glycosyltransferase
VHFLYYEDMDLGWRARLAGWSTRYVPTSIVHHRWHGSSDRHGKTRLKVMANINRIRMLLKNASVSFILATLPRTLKEAAEIVRYGRLQSVLRLLTAIKLSLVNRRRITAMVRTPRLQVEREFRARPLRG